MPAVFGLEDGNKANPFPLARIIEAGTGICSTDLRRAGLMFEGAVGTVLVGTVPCRTRAGRAEVFVDGTRLRTRPDPVLNFRHWVCPVCDRSCRQLYCISDHWACRQCYKLDYASRHVFRSLPGYHRARWLRRRLQLPLQLFSAVPDYRKHHTRKRRARLCRRKAPHPVSAKFGELLECHGHAQGKSF